MSARAERGPGSDAPETGTVDVTLCQRGRTVCAIHAEGGLLPRSIADGDRRGAIAGMASFAAACMLSTREQVGSDGPVHPAERTGGWEAMETIARHAADGSGIPVAAIGMTHAHVTGASDLSPVRIVYSAPRFGDRMRCVLEQEDLPERVRLAGAVDVAIGYVGDDGLSVRLRPHVHNIRLRPCGPIDLLRAEAVLAGPGRRP